MEEGKMHVEEGKEGSNIEWWLSLQDDLDDLEEIPVAERNGQMLLLPWKSIEHSVEKVHSLQNSSDLVSIDPIEDYLYHCID